MSNTESVLQHVIKKINALPAFLHMDARVVSLEAGNAEISIDEAKAFHRGGISGAAINGMTIMGLLDAAMCAAVLASAPGRTVATLDISTRFVRPAIGRSVVAIGRIVSKAKHLCYCEAFLVNDRKRQCAFATGLIQIIR